MSDKFISPDGFIFNSGEYTANNTTSFDMLVEKTLDGLEKLLQEQKTISSKNKEKLLAIIQCILD